VRVGVDDPRMSENNAVIMMVVLLLLGAKLLGDGLAGIRQ
jgi:hypothetical protein